MSLSRLARIAWLSLIAGMGAGLSLFATPVAKFGVRLRQEAERKLEALR